MRVVDVAAAIVPAVVGVALLGLGLEPGRTSGFSGDIHLLNRTLGIYDTPAMHVRRKVVPRTRVLD
jgi:hypothetical protein